MNDQNPQDKPEVDPPVKPTKVQRPRLSLSKLLEGVTPENQHEPIDFGPPVGKELI